MTEIKNAGRQSPLVAEVAFTFEDLVSAVAKAAADLPAGATVVGGEVIIDTAWDTGTTDVLDIGDGDNGSRYANDVNLKATGRTALTLTGYKYAAADTVDLTKTAVGTAPTQGAGRLHLHYIISGRASEAG